MVWVWVRLTEMTSPRREGGGIARGAGQQVVSCEEIVDGSGDLDVGVDEHERGASTAPPARPGIPAS